MMKLELMWKENPAGANGVKDKEGGNVKFHEKNVVTDKEKTERKYTVSTN